MGTVKPTKAEKKEQRKQQKKNIKSLKNFIKPDIVPKTNKMAIFGISEKEGISKRGIKMKYLIDSGCIGINIGGIDLYENLKKNNIPFDEIDVSNLVVNAAWKDKVRVQYLIRVHTRIDIDGYQLNTSDTLLHILNKPTSKVFLGTRWRRQNQFLTEEQQLKIAAKRQHGLLQDDEEISQEFKQVMKKNKTEISAGGVHEMNQAIAWISTDVSHLRARDMEMVDFESAKVEKDKQEASLNYFISHTEEIIKAKMN